MRENLRIGDTDAPIIPTLNVHAKNEAINEELGAKKKRRGSDSNNLSFEF